MTASLALAFFYVFRMYYLIVRLDHFVFRIYLFRWRVLWMSIEPNGSC